MGLCRLLGRKARRTKLKRPSWMPYICIPPKSRLARLASVLSAAALAKEGHNVVNQALSPSQMPSHAPAQTRHKVVLPISAGRDSSIFKRPASTFSGNGSRTSTNLDRLAVTTQLKLGSAVVSTAVFGVPPKTSYASDKSPIGGSRFPPEPVGGTPTGGDRDGRATLLNCIVTA